MYRNIYLFTIYLSALLDSKVQKGDFQNKLDFVPKRRLRRTFKDSFQNKKVLKSIN